jgi:hypothetical protein
VAHFQATPEDLGEIIRRQQVAALRRQARYPVGALAVAALLAPVYQPAALVALGVGIGWGLSTYWELRSVRAAYLWRYAWLQEPVDVEVLEEGIRLSSQRGSSLIRWSGGIVVRSLPGCFVLEDEGEDMAVLPKRYLDSTELMLLQNRVTV